MEQTKKWFEKRDAFGVLWWKFFAYTRMCVFGIIHTVADRCHRYHSRLYRRRRRWRSLSDTRERNHSNRLTWFFSGKFKSTIFERTPKHKSEREISNEESFYLENQMNKRQQRKMCTVYKRKMYVSIQRSIRPKWMRMRYELQMAYRKRLLCVASDENKKAKWDEK